jgi:uncharacterized protein
MTTPTPNTTEPKPKSRKGFAAMTPEKRSAIASLGGQAAHKLGRAHQFTSEEARAAGQKGGRNKGIYSAARKAASE